ncbi:putative serine-threonine protein kinase [Streptomyces collinus Tu 365]|uniref:Putative serine-threonine protein kinase n=1 Tax=Streptomyces collinus (strain DSM 40733 / Tue 365) TaxID=1214242 RepID=S5VZY7_STRC3|nr:putative serine-threonine protein kinase [Streptomyces collinus Tu 365]AGS73600.1 putative serine-threonine protein kinase [Streptomyces collinus Tu 365]
MGAGDPDRVGPYRVVGRLGAGGMGRVYLARSKGGRAVAVKVVRPELAEDREFRQRFAREVAAARRVNGVFTAGVVDADPDADPPWLATAYVPGISLDTAVARHGAWQADPVTTLAAGLAEALEAIHAAGLVHRDLKPSNVLLAADGPRVIDFGISTATEASAITRTGVVIGTPGFMSPEQLTGEPVGPASDVFALGAVLAFTASGSGPFGTGSAQGLMYRIVHGDPDLDAVPGPIRGLVGRCLAKRPGDRPTVDALLSELIDAAGTPRTALLFTNATWLPPTVAAEVRGARDGDPESTVPETPPGGGRPQGGTPPAPDPAGRNDQAPTVTGPVPPTPPPAYTPTAVLPTPVPRPPGKPSRASTGRRRAAVIGSVIAGVVAIGLVAWQADAVLGAGAGSGSGASSPGSSPYGSPTPLDGPSSPAATPTPLDSPYTPAGTPDDSPTPPASTPPEDSPSAPASDVTDLSGQWDGSYVCNQGITGLVLTIEDHGDGTVDAVFAFYPAPSNPQVPRGSFAMAGTLQSGVLTLRATRWIEQPPNFLAVNLQGTYDTRTPDHLDGRVYGPNCTTFSADRS